MSNFQPKPREKNLLDGTNLRLYTPCPTPSGSGKMSSLFFSAITGNPRIIVRTGDPADEGNDYGRIQVKLSPHHFEMILSAIQEALDATGKFSAGFNVTGFIGKPARPELTQRVVVGRDSEGVIFIVVRDLINQQRPVVKFPFTGDRNLKMVDHEGNPMNPALESRIAARGWMQLLRTVMSDLCVRTWREPQTKNNGQGGQRGGGNFQRGGGGGYQGGNGGQQGNQQAASMDIDDDIMF